MFRLSKYNTELPLLYQENKSFIDKKSPSIYNFEETASNFGAALSTPKRLVGIFILLLIVIICGIINVSLWREFSATAITISILGLSLSLIALLIRGIYGLVFRKSHAEIIFEIENLATMGQIVIGSVESQDLVGFQAWRIIYSFKLPSGKIVRGRYKTQKLDAVLLRNVVILYLDAKTHTLL